MSELQSRDEATLSELASELTEAADAIRELLQDWAETDDAAKAKILRGVHSDVSTARVELGEIAERLTPEGE